MVMVVLMLIRTSMIMTAVSRNRTVIDPGMMMRDQIVDQIG
jgi:hypothetical protein